ncbi:Rho termination factor N-terminal domain-containing protein [Pseudomonas sp. UL073]|uniref:Rho termination factor N-terminal domain-containing protein n=1 Tax=Zestomonas insulae TaxID=2809017 RepID=A0ABS2IHW6_9GAMM|nr:Rho termination factor N-terminal domain-containing protein [Pseudomonas insulae]MBM7061919.1 Rho termination factor N-terminal domain-containing protein [Pseudomonas insulae]
MPRGSKAKYTDKQKRKAEHIEASYEAKGVSKGEAEARAWATVNKQSGGGEHAGGSGQQKSAAAKASSRRSSARRAVATKEGLPRSSRASLGVETKADLLKQAQAKNIPGRSTMRKQELIDALRKAS